MFYAMIVLFVVGYVLIAMEHPIKVNKTATALILGVMMWVIYLCGGDSIYNISGHIEDYMTYKTAHQDSLMPFVDFVVNDELLKHLGSIAEILFFLMGAMTIVELIDSCQGFRIITDHIKTKNKVKLLWILGFTTFFLSAVLDNLTTAIVMIALLRKLVYEVKERWLYAGIIIIAANAGGAWSPIGDVTTIMLWIANRFTSEQIILQTFLASLVSLIIPLIAVSFTMKGEIKTRSQEESTQNALPQWQRHLIFFLGIGFLLFVPIFKTLTHLKPYMGIMLGLGILWVVTEILSRKTGTQKSPFRITAILQRIDLPSILFFLGILLAVSALQSAGHLSLLSTKLDGAMNGNYYAINLMIGFLSSVVDNVPLVAGAMGMYDFPINDMFWIFLAYCAGTGGSILIIGSAAGVAVMGMEKIDFVWYLKKITPYAILGYLSGAGIFMLTDHFIF